jgi:hypothetical protein
MPELAAAPELLGAGAEGAGAGGMGEMGGMDFNDMPFQKIAGQMGGKLVHAAMGAIGTHGGDQETANIGPVGKIT